jgi:thiol-disulfide isomerase/thioredoxin
MRKAFFVLTLLYPFILFAQFDLTKKQSEMIGKKIKELTITDYLLNKPANTNFNHTFKVVEFWATWCKPCLRAVPHLNRLQNKFNNRDVVFISFTYESPAVTIKTLEKVKFQSIVVSDQTKNTHRSLHIEYNGTMVLPRTVLIDDENNIVWYGKPNQLSEKLLEKFLRKEKLLN